MSVVQFSVSTDKNGTWWMCPRCRRKGKKKNIIDGLSSVTSHLIRSKSIHCPSGKHNIEHSSLILWYIFILRTIVSAVHWPFIYIFPSHSIVSTMSRAFRTLFRHKVSFWYKCSNVEQSNWPFFFFIDGHRLMVIIIMLHLYLNRWSFQVSCDGRDQCRCLMKIIRNVLKVQSIKQRNLVLNAFRSIRGLRTLTGAKIVFIWTSGHRRLMKM